MGWFKRIKRQNTSKLLVGTSIAFLLPIFYLLFYSILGYNGYIEFAQKEKIGALVLTDLKPIIMKLSDYQTSSNKGNISLDFEFEVLLTNFKKYETNLGLSLQELKEKNKQSLHPENIYYKWKALKNNTIDYEKLSELLSDLSSLYLYIGDISNLILDPDLDSYYIMDAVLLAFPQSLKRVYDLRYYLNTVSKDQINYDNRIYLSVFYSSFSQADYSRINASINTAFEQDANFYGQSPSLKRAISPPLLNFNTNSELLLDEVKGANSIEGEIDIRKINKISKSIIEYGDVLWSKSIEELITLLDIRIKDYKYERLKTITIAIALVVLAYFVLFFVAQATTRKINYLVSFMNNIGNGNIHEAQTSIIKMEEDYF